MFRRIAVLLVVGSMLLAACGGDGGNGDAVEDGGGDGGAGAAFDEVRCAQVVQAMAAAAAAVPQSMSGDAGGLESSIDQLEAFASAAPEEIREDLSTIYEGYARVAGAMADSGYDPASGAPPDAQTIAALQAAAQTLDTADFRAASDRVNGYFERECG
jgi:predicted small secreted protein